MWAQLLRGWTGLEGRGRGGMHAHCAVLTEMEVAPVSPRSCLCRGSHSCSLQDQDGHLRDTSEPGGPHVGQLPDLAPVRGGEALHRLLQHEQRQVPALAGPPPERQGEPPQPCSSWSAWCFFSFIGA